MRLSFLFLLIYFSSLLCHAAEFYKCETVDGKATYTDKECDSSSDQETIKYKRILTSREKIEKKNEQHYKQIKKAFKEFNKALESTQIGMSELDFRTGDGVGVKNIKMKENITKSIYGDRVQIIVEHYGDRTYYYFRDGILTTIND